MRLDVLDFYSKLKKLLAFCIKRVILFLMLPIPYSNLVKESKTQEFNCIINDLTFYKFELEYKNWDLATDGLNLTNRCITEKSKSIKSILNLAVANSNENLPN